ncbi:SAM-dependent methyltransferase [Massilia sp. GCM10020059]|uniref:Class I SAM-dependent methyltransferase n=1 Tax=Massilia agrisoli TaxID=2892444 RepID=A0ABS8INT5_9BURK|nr:class I SAM-dependent methyltransferase [Massilia agrisoli]MCC6069536.1 class I SAM-dependent methyltransferase [Massilia agrisoli]
MRYPHRIEHPPGLAGLLSRLALLLLLAGAAVAQAWSQSPRLDVPFVPTPQPVVDRMLDLAKVQPDDLIYDLGSGDGRIVITAAKRYGARGVGIDLDPQRIREARENAREAGVEGKVQFINGDLFKTDLSKASVVTLYLLNSVNRDLRPQLWKQLKVGTRVVSHAFDMGDEWPPERVEEVDGRTIYYWTITEANKRAARRSAAAGGRAGR